MNTESTELYEQLKSGNTDSIEPKSVAEEHLLNMTRNGVGQGDGSSGDTEPRSRIEAYLKNMIENGIPSSGSGSSTGGISIDVTAKVGQTIIVKEVDANGKPTKWESAEYQPRTHWSEENVILPETTIKCVEMDADGDGVGDGLFMGELPDILPVEGIEYYNVTYNGVAYPCKLQKTIDDESTLIYGMGNIGFATGGESTGEPFIMQFQYDKTGDVWSNAILTIDGSTSVTLSIAETVYHTIPLMYLPKACVIDVDENTSPGFSITIDTTELANAILNDLPIFVNLVTINSFTNNNVVERVIGVPYRSIDPTVASTLKEWVQKMVLISGSAANLIFNIQVYSFAQERVIQIFINLPNED